MDSSPRTASSDWEGLHDAVARLFMHSVGRVVVLPDTEFARDINLSALLQLLPLASPHQVRTWFREAYDTLAPSAEAPKLERGRPAEELSFHFTFCLVLTSQVVNTYAAHFHCAQGTVPNRKTVTMCFAHAVAAQCERAARFLAVAPIASIPASAVTALTLGPWFRATVSPAAFLYIHVHLAVSPHFPSPSPSHMTQQQQSNSSSSSSGAGAGSGSASTRALRAAPPARLWHAPWWLAALFRASRTFNHQISQHRRLTSPTSTSASTQQQQQSHSDQQFDSGFSAVTAQLNANAGSVANNSASAYSGGSSASSGSGGVGLLGHASRAVSAAKVTATLGATQIVRFDAQTLLDAAAGFTVGGTAPTVVAAADAVGAVAAAANAAAQAAAERAAVARAATTTAFAVADAAGSGAGGGAGGGALPTAADAAAAGTGAGAGTSIAGAGTTTAAGAPASDADDAASADADALKAATAAAKIEADADYEAACAFAAAARVAESAAVASVTFDLGRCALFSPPSVAATPAASAAPSGAVAVAAAAGTAGAGTAGAGRARRPATGALVGPQPPQPMSTLQAQSHAQQEQDQTEWATKAQSQVQPPSQLPPQAEAETELELSALSPSPYTSPALANKLPHAQAPPLTPGFVPAAAPSLRNNAGSRGFGAAAHPASATAPAAAAANGSAGCGGGAFTMPLPLPLPMPMPLSPRVVPSSSLPSSSSSSSLSSSLPLSPPSSGLSNSATTSVTAVATRSGDGGGAPGSAFDSLFAFAAVAEFHSCFRRKFATPRQGALTPHSRGVVSLRPGVEHTVWEGITSFSHVWLVYVFDCNTPQSDTRTVANANGVAAQPVIGAAAATAATAALGGSPALPVRVATALRTKVKPPKLGGRATGAFATRAPHRPNPIGLTLVKVEGLIPGANGSAQRLLVSGVDLIDGTPILDVKPYHPADCPLPLPLTAMSQQQPSMPSSQQQMSAGSESQLRFPSWISSQFHVPQTWGRGFSVLEQPLSGTGNGAVTGNAVAALPAYSQSHSLSPLRPHGAQSKEPMGAAIPSVGDYESETDGKGNDTAATAAAGGAGAGAGALPTPTLTAASSLQSPQSLQSTPSLPVADTDTAAASTLVPPAGAAPLARTRSEPTPAAINTALAQDPTAAIGGDSGGGDRVAHLLSTPTVAVFALDSALVSLRELFKASRLHGSGGGSGSGNGNSGGATPSGGLRGRSLNGGGGGGVGGSGANCSVGDSPSLTPLAHGRRICLLQQQQQQQQQFDTPGQTPAFLPLNSSNASGSGSIGSRQRPLEFFCLPTDTAVMVLQCACEVLAADPRSVHTVRKFGDRSVFAFEMDNLVITFVMRDVPVLQNNSDSGCDSANTGAQAMEDDGASASSATASLSAVAAVQTAFGLDTPFVSRTASSAVQSSTTGVASVAHAVISSIEHVLGPLPSSAGSSAAGQSRRVPAPPAGVSASTSACVSPSAFATASPAAGKMPVSGLDGDCDSRDCDGATTSSATDAGTGSAARTPNFPSPILPSSTLQRNISGSSSGSGGGSKAAIGTPAFAATPAPYIAASGAFAAAAPGLRTSAWLKTSGNAAVRAVMLALGLSD